MLTRHTTRDSTPTAVGGSGLAGTLPRPTMVTANPACIGGVDLATWRFTSTRMRISREATTLASGFLPWSALISTLED